MHSYDTGPDGIAGERAQTARSVQVASPARATAFQPLMHVTEPRETPTSVFTGSEPQRSLSA
jgi:hypothetical protein